METRINVAELLKDCPSGMELDCVMFDNVSLIHVLAENAYPIKIETPAGQVSLDKYGCYSSNKHAKCVIFPKEKTTWKGFVTPYKFKDGDVIYKRDIKSIAIYNKQTDDVTISHCFLNILGKLIICHHHRRDLSDWRLATEEEKEELFQAIKANGYRWNEKKKILEKLVTEKFDVNTLVPFESRVLVRDSEAEKWRPAIWGYHDSDSPYNYPYEVVGGHGFSMCIPYEGNGHLLGTTEDCEDRYKLWLS